MTADDKYSLRNSENLPQPIQTKLSKNLNTFFQHFPQFLQSTSSSNSFQQNDDPRGLCISEITDGETHGWTNG